MNSLQEEEIESLRAIFCKDDEFVLKTDTESQMITVNFYLCPMMEKEHGSQQQTIHGSIHIVLTPDYPETQQPSISIKCLCLPAANTDTVKQKIEEAATLLQGQPMLLDLCLLAQELLESEIRTNHMALHKTDSYGLTPQLQVPGVVTDRYLQRQHQRDSVSEATDGLSNCGLNKASKLKSEYSQSVSPRICQSDLEHSQSMSSRTCQSNYINFSHSNENDKSQDPTESNSKLVTVLLQLDHMRSKHSYIKLIKKWTQELNLTGRLIFCNKLIFILLQGAPQAIREYIIRNRTTNVDVDSKGRPCKERMLTVLCEVPAESHKILSEFCVQELASFKSLQEMLENCSMGELYQEYIGGLILVPGKKITSSKHHK